jgi:uncharacterized protein (DUF1778 family)
MASKVVRRKADDDRRTLYLRVRLTGEQDQLVKDAAKLAGITVSAWAVRHLVRVARQELRGEKD